MYCPHCGKDFGEGYQFCPYCGQSQQKNIPKDMSQSEDSKNGDSFSQLENNNRLDLQVSLPDLRTRLTEAGDTGTRPEVLAKLAKDKKKDVRKSVARNPATPPSILLELAKDKKKEVRFAVAFNTNTGLETLTLLAKDKKTDIRSGVAGNAHISPEAQLALSTDNNHHVRLTLSRNARILREAQIKLTRDKESDVRLAIALHTGADPIALALLATDRRRDIRQKVVDNINVSPETLAWLANDFDKKIRVAVARNTHTTSETQIRLTRDKEKDVRIALITNRHTSSEVLALLAEDRDRSVKLTLADVAKIAPGKEVRPAESNADPLSSPRMERKPEPIIKKTTTSGKIAVNAPRKRRLNAWTILAATGLAIVVIMILISRKVPSPIQKDTITAGVEIQIAKQSIGPTGGTITFNKPGDPLSGFQIEVPANSYGDVRTFQVFYAPIKSHTFGTDFNPISPLITVDNGGGYSDEPMIVKIPVNIPDGQFAMPFFYDENGTLEGVPVLAEDRNLITMATRHFSRFTVSSIDKQELLYHVTGRANSGFKPGVDDWQFPNYGSYIEPGGHCAGQSITAMWYYYQKTLKGFPHLYGLYDNNGRQWKTPNLWQDDTYGYKFASTVQSDMNWLNLGFKLQSFAKNVNDELTYNTFAYAVLKTGQPQFVGIYDNTGTGGGHAMVVYKVANGTLYVADPNFPGRSDRKIELIRGRFKAYDSAANAEEIRSGRVFAYDQINYFGKSPFVDWGKIETRWSQFERGTIGTIGSNRFPDFTLEVVEDSGAIHELKEGFSTDKPTLNIRAVSASSSGPKLVLATSVYRDNTWLRPVAMVSPGAYPVTKVALKEGVNLLGILVQHDTTNGSLWVDFRWVNVIRRPTPTPTVVGCTPGSALAQLTCIGKAGFQVAPNGSQCNCNDPRNKTSDFDFRFP